MSAPDHADLLAHGTELSTNREAEAAERDATAPWMDGPFAVFTGKDGELVAFNPHHVMGVTGDERCTFIVPSRPDAVPTTVREGFQTTVATLNAAWRAGR